MPAEPVAEAPEPEAPLAKSRRPSRSPRIVAASAGERRRGACAGRRARRGGAVVTAISAALVKELRDRTGAGMMDCKRALAGDGRRPRGRAEAAARAGHRRRAEARRPRDQRGQGRLHDRRRRSEGHDRRRRLRDRAGVEQRRVPGVRREGARSRRRGRDATPSSSSRTSASSSSAKLGENIADHRRDALRGRSTAAGSRVRAPAGEQAGRARRRCEVATPELGRQLAMQVAAAGPRWVSREDVPEEVVAAEREIYANSDEVKSKPEQAREKIVEGMLEQALLRRPGAHRPALDPRHVEDGRPGAVRGGRRGARVRRFALAE